VSRGGIRAALVAVAAALGALAAPVAASATTLWVAPVAASAPFDSCAHPGYDSIQQAVDGPGTIVHVCAGTYEEHVQVGRTVKIQGYGGATLKIPASPVQSSTPCDRANEALNGLPDQDALSICGGAVTIKNLNVEAVWSGEPIGPSVSCQYNLMGILVAGGADLTLTGSTVIGAAPHVINGCQYGLGILVGIPDSKAIGSGEATITKDTVSGYEKNGITAAGKGVELSVSKTTVTGAGPTPVIAQNGIGIQEGAIGTITKDTVLDNECEETPACGPDALTQAQADGVYFYDAASGSSVNRSTITDNDVGVEAFDSPSTDPLVSRDDVADSRDEAVQIGEGDATINDDSLTDANVGIQLLQYEGQTAAPGGTARGDTISGMHEWAVLGRSDDASGDLFGEFTITDSAISGNGGSTPQKSVETENPAKLKIYAEGDH
jgi:hypothetical protein